MARNRIKRLRKYLPAILMSLVITSGLIISFLGIYFVGQQKNDIILNVKKDLSVNIVQVASRLESLTHQYIEKAIGDIASGPLEFSNQQQVLARIKKLTIRYSIARYPFFINADGKFIFPFTGKAVPATVNPPELTIHNPAVRELYKKAQDIEFNQHHYLEAIRNYLRCLNNYGGTHIEPYIYSAVARCYFKLEKYSQAIAYYREILDHYPTQLGKDPTLYFRTLRQLALSFSKKGDTQRALRHYLKLYEEIPRYRITEDASTLHYFKNEALAYLNQHIERNRPETNRFKKAKESDRLDGASQLDISLRWRYFDIEEETRSLDQEITPDDHIKFLKLKELFNTTDNKSKFYRRIKRINHWPKLRLSSLQIQRFLDPESNIIQQIALQRMPQAQNGKSVFFGFMISDRFIRNVLLPQALEEMQQGDDIAYLFLKKNTDLQEEYPDNEYIHTLLSYSFQKTLLGNNLIIAARKGNFFETRARNKISIIYILIVALLFTLILGTYLFYKYIAREAELVKLKSEFVDSASHTLKTPLTRIRMLTEKLQLGWINEESRRAEYFRTIISETDLLTELVNNMLNFSKIEAGKKTYQFQNISLPMIVQEVMEQYTNHTNIPGFKIETFYHEDIPPLPMDPEAVKLIVMNLVQNAIKYSGKEKYISVRTIRQKDRAILEVSDRGAGIPEQDIPRLFEKFYRVNSPQVTALEGSGLGLYLVKHAVIAHKGKIDVASQLGKGTTFTIYFPLQGELNV
jgi:signal transduction histidine kinase